MKAKAHSIGAPEPHQKLSIVSQREVISWLAGRVCYAAYVRMSPMRSELGLVCEENSYTIPSYKNQADIYKYAIW